MELGVKIKSEWEEAAALEPHPDIHELFCHYNSLYFNDALNACIVDWSDSRTAKSAGMCSYLEDGGCEIRLSVPLLKFRSTADLKNTLLHEMIHAFLYVTSNKRNRSYHGPPFLSYNECDKLQRQDRSSDTRWYALVDTQRQQTNQNTKTK